MCPCRRRRRRRLSPGRSFSTTGTRSFRDPLSSCQSARTSAAGTDSASECAAPSAALPVLSALQPFARRCSPRKGGCSLGRGAERTRDTRRSTNNVTCFPRSIRRGEGYCYCLYGTVGLSCEITRPETCPNDCGGADRGRCIRGAQPPSLPHSLCRSAAIPPGPQHAPSTGSVSSQARPPCPPFRQAFAAARCLSLGWTAASTCRTRKWPPSNSTSRCPTPSGAQHRRGIALRFFRLALPRNSYPLVRVQYNRACC